MPESEPWPRIYREAPEIFEAFTRAEDPQGLIVQRLRVLAGLAGRRVLELGCGTGRFSREWARGAAAYVASDPSSRLLEVAKPAAGDASVLWVRARGQELPFRDLSMDRVLATWVLAYLRPEACHAAVQEALRVLGGKGGIWLVENHWTGGFQELRQREGYGGEPGVRRLLEDHGFRLVEVLETELRFNSTTEAEHILGALCGPAVQERLVQHPRSHLSHNVVILHRPGSEQDAQRLD